MRRTLNVYRSEEGAILIQVGLSILVLMALNVFVIDYGVLWVARSQAQTAADAGALAGAVGMAYDVRVTTPADILLNAQAVATDAANHVWKTPPSAVAQATSVPCPADAGAGTCVQVDVFRNSANGNTLPTIFGKILGINDQGVQARATASIGHANTTTCLRPWALPDEWREFGSGTELDPLDSTSTFHRWKSDGTTDSNPDSYTRPDATQATTATNFSTDYGDVVQFQLNYPLTDPIRRGFMLPLLLPGTHLQNMTQCNGQPVAIGETLTIDEGLSPADAATAAQTNYLSDSTADWSFDGSIGTGYVRNSCAPTCAPVSPRLWAVALYDPSEFELRRATNNWSACPVAGTKCVTVVNIVGFFIDYLDPTTSSLGQHGHFARYPGITGAGPTIAENGSWLVEPRLIR
jgi:Flp pilus assembly protein TadG